MSHTIVSDIFGKTAALEKIAAALRDDTKIIDPYNAKNMAFNSEAEAYTYFSSKVGMERYTLTLLDHIKSASQPVTLIGFSVGASAIWNISEQIYPEYVSRAMCFYGSQIRNDKNINPAFPVQLIFPALEQHFSVTELITALSNKENVTITQAPYFHGFMNTHSQNYDQAGYEQFISELKSFLS